MIDLDELERLERDAFRAPWTYSRWEVECAACDGGSNEPEDGCPNPDCNGSDAPIVAVESPEEYPEGQLVAQISVPGLLSLADKNGALITAARNALPELIARARRLERVEACLARQLAEAYGHGADDMSRNARGECHCGSADLADANECPMHKLDARRAGYLGRIG